MPATFLASKMDHVCRKTYEDSFLEVTPKKGLNDHCVRKFVGKSCTQSFWESLGKFGNKFFPPQKIYLLLRQCHLAPALYIALL